MPRYNSAASGSTVIEPPVAPAPNLGLAPTPEPIKPPAPASGLKRVSFGKIAKKDETTKTAYPVFPDPNQAAAEIAGRIKKRQEEFDALEGALKTDKQELKFLVAPHYFTVNHGKQEIPSSVSVKTSDGEEVLVSFQNRYGQLPDESTLIPVLGDRISEFFRQSFELKIKGDALPAASTQNLLDELQELFAKYGASDALEVKEGIKPTDTFHTHRHKLLTPEQNLALEQVCPIVAQIKTKGRK